jgi:transcriptional regulator with XRE-family HTH domain
MYVVKHMTLRQARQAKGWTQEDLEARSGVGQDVISRLERRTSGADAVTFGTIQKLEAALQLKASLRRGALLFTELVAEEARTA